VLLLWSALFQISDGIQVVIIGALRGMQDVRVAAVITFVSYWLVGFPISYYLGLKTDFGAEGIWMGLLAGLTVSSILLYVRFNYLVTHKINVNVTT
jgi:MATE family multidrug resistance protein